MAELMVQGISGFRLDVIPRCLDMECPAYEYCQPDLSTSKVKVVREGGCWLVYHYLESIANEVRSCYPQLTPDQTLKVGSLLLPQYRVLCRLQIEEMGLRRLVIENARGGLKVNPLYSEIRETMKLISRLWREIGLEEVSRPGLDWVEQQMME